MLLLLLLLQEGEGDETLLSCLRDLFNQMTSHKKRVGTIGPRKFVQKLKEENFMFRGLTQQDAHEFLNFTINEVSDLLRRDEERHAELVKQGKLPPEPEPPPRVGAGGAPETEAQAAARKKRSVFPSFSAIFKSKIQKLPLFSCI